MVQNNQLKKLLHLQKYTTTRVAPTPSSKIIISSISYQYSDYPP